MRLPLDSFVEHGAWDGVWHEPERRFDWSLVDRLEIVAEHHDLVGQRFLFDDLRLVAPDGTAVALAASDRSLDYALEANYPNPFNANTVLRHRLGKRSPVDLSVYNAVGQRVRTLERRLYLVDPTARLGMGAMSLDAMQLVGYTIIVWRQTDF